ncbi:protein kinase [Micromonospora soli]|uniref:serine/threonine protein kinase n=1 Tax=Micromonospora sp. NBRC 110009 TaxID=3061627 RepID=UPI002672446A|nr:protein kinase [Micromonospora sp. NBRC 110009]WKT97800.1 protein kinase [Micromonospora sp. NBRC 110009]
MSGWQLSGYTPVRRLGAGASGSVMLATHDATGTPVAIKYLVRDIGDDPSFRSAFREEARLLGEIDDPHVSRLYEYVESPGGAAIVMELVNGVSLRQMLRAHGPTTPESALCVLKGSLAGLAAAHAHGVVHRDYKPENVLVTGEALSKLADFGIAMPVGRGSDTTVSGTPRYMAPEQWTGAPASPACDIYAATATFFECLTGRPPYQAGDLLALREQHASAPIPTDPAPAPVHDLLRHGMAKQPADRPQPAQVFLELLDRVAGAAYGPDWERRGLRELARRAALLAALWPFPDGTGGATSLASTVLGAGAAPVRRGLFRRGRKRTALVGGALVAALLAGGAGYRYAAQDDPAVAAAPPAPAGVDPAATDPQSSSPTDAGTPSPTPGPSGSASPTPAAAPSATPSRSRPATPTRSPVRTTAPVPTPSTSTPPPDGTAPTVGDVTANPGQLEPKGCPYGYQTSTVAAKVTDDRSGPAALEVSFRYTLEGVTATVGMSSAGRGVFRGTLGPLPAPRQSSRIPVQVTAVDAAGNTATSASPVYVTLYNYCSPG